MPVCVPMSSSPTHAGAGLAPLSHPAQNPRCTRLARMTHRRQPRAPAQPIGKWAASPRQNQGLWTALLVLGALVLLGDILSAVTAPAALRTFEAAAAEGRDPAEVFTAHDAVDFLGGGMVLLALWIVGALWVSRARENAIPRAVPGPNRTRPAVQARWAALRVERGYECVPALGVRALPRAESAARRRCLLQRRTRSQPIEAVAQEDGSTR